MAINFKRVTGLGGVNFQKVTNGGINSLGTNSIVADLGAGTGFYSVAAGHIVSRGKVYAVEIVKDFLVTIKIHQKLPKLTGKIFLII